MTVVWDPVWWLRSGTKTQVWRETNELELAFWVHDFVTNWRPWVRIEVTPSIWLEVDL